MTTDWKPGYSTIKTRYPYDCIESKTIFSNRPEFHQDKEGKVGVLIDIEKYPKFAEVSDGETVDAKQTVIDFLMDRAFDFQEALKVCENQVAELLSEDPFLPEQFGFDIIHKPESIHDSPIRIYQSKYNDKYTLHRPVQDVMEDSYDPSIWILQTKNDDDTITSEELCIPCHRIAFAYFYAKKIQVMEEVKKDFIQDVEVLEESRGVLEMPIEEEDYNESVSKEIAQNASQGPAVEENPKTQEKTKLWDIEWNTANREPVMIHNIPAETAQDAKTKAKFMIETGDYGVDVVDFEDLYIGVGSISN